MPRPCHLQAPWVQGLISLINGAITLVLLLIAPLGLASVVTLTLLITASTFCCGVIGRGLQLWLERSAGTSAGPDPIGHSKAKSLPGGTRRLPRR